MKPVVGIRAEPSIYTPSYTQGGRMCTYVFIRIDLRIYSGQKKGGEKQIILNKLYWFSFTICLIAFPGTWAWLYLCMCLLEGKGYLETEVICQFPFHVIQLNWIIMFSFQEPGTPSREIFGTRRYSMAQMLLLRLPYFYFLCILTPEICFSFSHICLVLFYRYIRSIEMNISFDMDTVLVLFGFTRIPMIKRWRCHAVQLQLYIM